MYAVKIQRPEILSSVGIAILVLSPHPLSASIYLSIYLCLSRSLFFSFSLFLSLFIPSICLTLCHPFSFFLFDPRSFFLLLPLSLPPSPSLSPSPSPSPSP